jgi:signal transduction histidine kinase/ActR/RegA family two-component response regulator
MSYGSALSRWLLRPFTPLSSFAGVRQPVRGKLMRVVLITTVIALCVAGTLMLSVDVDRYQQSWTTELAAEASILGVSVEPAMAFDDHEAAIRDLNALKVRPQVMAAALYSADGTLYASFTRPGSLPLPQSVPAPGMVTSGEHAEYSRPIERNGERLGTIYLQARYDILGRVGDYLLIFVLVTVLSMLVALLLSRRLQQAMLQPLDDIAVIANAIVRRRDYSSRAKKTSQDEIGVVVDAFNNMLEEVQTRARALESSNRALSEEVEVRKTAQEALRDADRRKDEFLATLAHELRNPLAPIRHAARLLESRSMDETKQKWARDVISRQVRRMALLLDDLLDVSRITRGRLQLKLETVTLASIVDAAVEIARPLIDARHHHLKIELPATPVLLTVDPLRISQSLANLLTNSAKYTDGQGQIKVTARVLENGLVLAVQDNGIGFAPETASHLFEMFSQATSAVARSEGGLGIGLALVKGLIGLHSGSVEAHSPGVGQGSEFVLHLPRSAVSFLPSEEPGESPAVARSQPLACRIVVADDNRDAADSLAMLLQSQGYQVTVGYSGTEALQMTRVAAPHVAILDVGMPDMTGYEVAARIRAAPWGRDICLIAVTGWGQEDDKARAAAAGFDHHLTKPVDPDEVERLLQAAFSARGNLKSPPGGT